MYQFVRELGLREVAIREAVPLGGALVLAELFYKFHSFTLEAVAFLVTWFALSAFGSWIRDRTSTNARRA
jgi:hypothetical protein